MGPRPGRAPAANRPECSVDDAETLAGETGRGGFIRRKGENGGNWLLNRGPHARGHGRTRIRRTANSGASRATNAKRVSSVAYAEGLDDGTTDHIATAIQPTIVHPSRRFTTAIAPM